MSVSDGIRIGFLLLLYLLKLSHIYVAVKLFFS